MKRFMLIFCSLLIAFGATAQSKLGSQTPKKSIFITSILLVLMTLVSCSVGYKNDGKEVTWHTWNEGSVILQGMLMQTQRLLKNWMMIMVETRNTHSTRAILSMVPMAARSVCLPNRMQQTIRMYMFPVN